MRGMAVGISWAKTGFGIDIVKWLCSAVPILLIWLCCSNNSTLVFGAATKLLFQQALWPVTLVTSNPLHF